MCHVSRTAVRTRRHAHLRSGGGELSVRVLDALGARVQLDHGEVELLRSVVTLSLGVASGDIRSRDLVGCGCRARLRVRSALPLVTQFLLRVYTALSALGRR